MARVTYETNTAYSVRPGFEPTGCLAPDTPAPPRIFWGYAHAPWDISQYPNLYGEACDSEPAGLAS